MPWTKYQYPNPIRLRFTLDSFGNDFFHVLPDIMSEVEYTHDATNHFIHKIKISSCMNDVRFDVFANDPHGFHALRQGLGPHQYYEIYSDLRVSFTAELQDKNLISYFFNKLLILQPDFQAEINSLSNRFGFELNRHYTDESLHRWYKNIKILELNTAPREFSYYLSALKPLSSIHVKTDQSELIEMTIFIPEINDYEDILNRLGRRAYLSANFYTSGSIRIATRDRRLLAYVMSKLHNYGDIHLKNLIEELSSDIRISMKRAYNETELALKYPPMHFERQLYFSPPTMPWGRPSTQIVTQFQLRNQLVGSLVDNESEYYWEHILCWMGLREWLKAQNEQERNQIIERFHEIEMHEERGRNLRIERSRNRQIRDEPATHSYNRFSQQLASEGRIPTLDEYIRMDESISSVLDSSSQPRTIRRIAPTITTLPIQQPLIAPPPIPILASTEPAQTTRGVFKAFKRKRKDIQVIEEPNDDWICPITGELMENPVNFPYCINKHCYEESAIREYISKTHNPVNPLSREPINANMITANLVIKVEIEAYKRAKLIAEIPAVEGRIQRSHGSGKCIVM